MAEEGVDLLVGGPRIVVLALSRLVPFFLLAGKGVGFACSR